MTILINDKPYEWLKSRISHLQLIIFAKFDPFGKMAHIEISYSIMRGQMKEHGYLKPGSSVRVGEGMEFRVRVKNQTTQQI